MDITFDNVEHVRDVETVANMRYLTRLIQSMSRYTILISVAAGTTIIGTILTFSLMSLVFGFDGKKEMISTMVGSTNACCDALINMACLIFQFEFSKNVYFTICFKCHRMCEDRYTHQANKQQRQSQLQLVRLPTGAFGVQKSTTNVLQVGAGNANLSQSSVKVDDMDDEIIRNQPHMSGATQSISIVGKQSIAILDA